jgi:hypothetical protein
MGNRSRTFNDGLLKDFAHKFYGYGSWRAPIWFIGMEEGGGKTFQEIKGSLP